MWGGTESNRGREIIIRIRYVREKLFSIKEEGNSHMVFSSLCFAEDLGPPE